MKTTISFLTPEEPQRLFAAILTQCDHPLLYGLPPRLPFFVVTYKSPEGAAPPKAAVS